MVSNNNLLNTLLTSLPDSWSTFITTLSSENLIPQILNEDCIHCARLDQQTALKVDRKKDKGLAGAVKKKC